MNPEPRALVLVLALVAFIVALIVHPPPDRLRQPTFWIAAGLALVTFVWLWDALVAID